MPVAPPDEEMLARMPMPRDEYEKLRPRSRFTVLRQKLLNMIARITIHPGLRLWLYRQMGVNIGRDCVVEMYANLDDQFPELIFIEDHSGPSRHVIILCHNDAGARVGHNESSGISFTKSYGFVAPVRLESHAGVSAGTILLPGVTIHEGALVGAGAVVTKDVPPYTVAVGIPARVIKHLKPEEERSAVSTNPTLGEVEPERSGSEL
jgi:acetyltransferase-like isoleucine patch superfamily enzyme